MEEATDQYISESFWQRAWKRARNIFDSRVRGMTPHELDITDRLSSAESLIESLQKQVRDLCREREELQGKILTGEHMIIDLGNCIGMLRVQIEAEIVANARRIAVHRAWMDEFGMSK